MSGRFVKHETALAGLLVIERLPQKDARGAFERLYCQNELQAFGVNKPLRQINRSMTHKRGTVRGLHFQMPPHSEIKIITCLRGSIHDVAVDLRQNSPTFLHHYAVELSERNNKTIIIPEGFAHGFQTLSDDCELLYLHTADYHQQAEAGFNPRDLRLAIGWPLAIENLSDRDARLPQISADFEGICP